MRDITMARSSWFSRWRDIRSPMRKPGHSRGAFGCGRNSVLIGLFLTFAPQRLSPAAAARRLDAHDSTRGGIKAALRRHGLAPPRDNQFVLPRLAGFTSCKAVWAKLSSV